MVNWKFPKNTQYKCNSDRAVKGNLGPSSVAFCVRNHQGDLIVAEAKRIDDTINLTADLVALRLGLELCVNQQLLPLILEIKSLFVPKFLTRQWKVPWWIATDIHRIFYLMEEGRWKLNTYSEKEINWQIF